MNFRDLEQHLCDPTFEGNREDAATHCERCGIRFARWDEPHRCEIIIGDGEMQTDTLSSIVLGNVFLERFMNETPEEKEERDFCDQQPVDGTFVRIHGSRLICKPDDDHLYWQKSHEHEQVPIDTIRQVSCGVCQNEALGFSWEQQIDVSDTQDNQTLQQTICLQCVYDTALHFRTQQEFLLKNGDPVTNYKKIFNETLVAQQREIQQLRADFARLKLFVARKSL